MCKGYFSVLSLLFDTTLYVKVIFVTSTWNHGQTVRIRETLCSKQRIYLCSPRHNLTITNGYFSSSGIRLKSSLGTDGKFEMPE